MPAGKCGSIGFRGTAVIGHNVRGEGLPRSEAAIRAADAINPSA